jgi:hypothetical protein
MLLELSALVAALSAMSEEVAWTVSVRAVSSSSRPIKSYSSANVTIVGETFSAKVVS